MKKILTILLVGFAFVSNAQQLPHYSLYMLNEAIINPASLSSKTENELTIMLKEQWASFEGAPSTQSISYNHLNHHKFKRGINVVNDVTGPISMLNATISGSYILPSKGKNSLALGGSASIMQYIFDNNQITLEDDGVLDPIINGGVDKVLGNSFTASAYYFNSDYFVGLSVPNIIGSSLDISENNSNNKLENHYYLNGGINFDLKNKYKVKPSVLIKKIGATPVQFDVNMRTIYDDFIWGGVTYRTGDAVALLMGLNYTNYNFAYSYDITTSSIRIPSAGSHGLLFTYKFKSKRNDKDKDGIYDEEDDCPRIPGLLALKGCPDKDKDGIKDSEDECPEEFGLKINNGCPDKDSDGVVDKKDECPEVPGLPKFKGCPDTDGDGLQDAYDDCPTERGPIQNHGCPKGASNTDTVYITVTDTVYITINNDTDLKKVFKDVKFESDKYILTYSSILVLSEVSNYLDEKALNIHITGHTDSQAPDEYNMELSENRVKAVQNYLVSKGISKSRIKIDWKGETEPIATNNTEEGREKNRRVELLILTDE
jgi:type IX secretion system PorP/SprF family membrane protein